PIVRATGGLVDTVASYDEANGRGTGFVFHDLDAGSLADTVGWAVSTWYNQPAHIETMRHRAMRGDHSGGQAASEYLEVYLVAYARRRGQDFPGAVSADRPEAVQRDPAETSRPARIREEQQESAAGRRALRGRNGHGGQRGRPTRRLARRASRG